MRKKALVFGLAAALTLSQAALAIGAGSPTVNNGSGGTHNVDGTTGSATTIVSGSGQTIQAGGGSSTSGSTAGTTVSQDTATAPTLSVVGGPSTGASVQAAPEITQEQAAAQTAGLAGYQTSVTATFTDYVAGAANAISAVNANPAALATLPSTEDLTQYVMLTGFQEVNVTDAQTGAAVNVAAGQSVAVSVPALMPGMQVYLLYVDPVTCLTVKVQATGVDYANQLVYVDASVPGAFTIVYAR